MGEDKEYRIATHALGWRMFGDKSHFYSPFWVSSQSKKQWAIGRENLFSSGRKPRGRCDKAVPWDDTICSTSSFHPLVVGMKWGQSVERTDSMGKAWWCIEQGVALYPILDQVDVRGAFLSLKCGSGKSPLLHPNLMPWDVCPRYMGEIFELLARWMAMLVWFVDFGKILLRTPRIREL